MMPWTLYFRASTPWFWAALGSLVMMSLIEWLKHVIWPSISTWESHTITILLTTGIISLSAHIIYTYVQMHSEAQSLMASIVESSDEGIIGQSLDGTVVSWNRGAEKLFGYSPEEVKGQSLRIVVPPDRYEEFQKITEKIGQGEHLNNYETVLMKKTGTRIHVSVSISPIMNGSGRAVGASAIVRDISERRKAQEELTRFNEQLRDLYRRLQSTREEERTRIAREIHDEFGQTLTALKIDLAWVKNRLNEDQVPLLQKIESMSKTISMAIRTVKKLSTDLRPGILDDFGLHAAIEWQAEEFEARTGTRCDVKLEVNDIAIDPDVSTAIFRILQETLTNIMRHADARKVELRLKEESGSLVFTVRDDGKGITKEGIAPTSYGLLGIRERVYSLGGTADIISSHGKGTMICVKIPLDQDRKEDDKDYNR